MEVAVEDFGLHPQTCTTFLWEFASDRKVEMKGFDELWMPESEDMLGSSSDWAEGDREVWQPEREGASGTSRAECFHLLTWLLIEGEEGGGRASDMLIMIDLHVVSRVGEHIGAHL